MVFNSFKFLIFFAFFYLFFVIVPGRFKWLWLLIASWFFYFTFKPIYLVVLLGLTVCDFICALAVFKKQGFWKIFFLIFALLVNIGTLLVFKYLGLFGELMAIFKGSNPLSGFSLVVPIGISFHTFQGMAYVIDVYRGKIGPEKKFGIFALFISIFPQLMAGPIERAAHLMPQLTRLFILSKVPFREAILLIATGYVKKMAIADSLGLVVDVIYLSPQNFNGATLAIATVFFGVQLYCDFSGYVDITRGLGKLMGIDFVLNFDKPYFSANITEFWRRWHISLSSWVRDYLYIPLGGNRFGVFRQHCNLIVTMVIMGLWHGSNLTFAVWGVYHGILLVFQKVISAAKIKVLKPIAVIFTFALVNLGWIFFRSENIEVAFGIIRSIFSYSLFSGIQYQPGMLLGAIFIFVLLFCEAADAKWNIWAKIINAHPAVVGFVYAALFYVFVFFSVRKTAQFIYFQF